MLKLRSVRQTCLTVVASVLVLSVSGLLVAAQRQQPRTLYGRQGPLVDRLRPDDREVEVVNDVRPLTVRFPPGTSPVIPKMGKSSALVIRALEMQSRLTETRDWIVSDWRMEVRDVLRVAPGHMFRRGDILSVPQEGGKVFIGQIGVSARLGWARELVVNQDYLVFPDWTTQAGISIYPTRAYRILPTGVLQARLLKGDDLDGKQFKAVADEIRTWARIHGGW